MEHLTGRAFVVLGGGVVGLSLSRLLARKGGDVILVEARQVGGGASGASAGVLKSPRGGPSLLARLSRASHAGYRRFVRELEGESGIPLEFLQCGYVDLALDEGEEKKLKKSMSRLPPGQARWLEGPEIRELLPGVTGRARGGLHLPESAWIDPRGLIAALRRSAEKLGVQIREGQRASLRRAGGEAGWTVLQGGPGGERISGREAIVATGAWTEPLLEEAGLAPAAPIQPIRGQMVELEFRHSGGPIIHQGGTYLIPRPGDRVWVGATVEEVGYDEGVTREGIQGLVSAARKVLPDLGRECRSWAGLRPKLLRRGGPLIGEGEPPVIAGHYRSGIQLGPVTAHVLVSRIAGEEVGEDFSGWTGPIIPCS